jgi:hypothetical protein
VGAMNALAWVAQGFDAARIERTWLRVGPSSIGFRWTTLLLRVAGAFLAVWSALEVVLTLLGSADPGVARLLLRRAATGEAPSWAYDMLAWLVMGAVGTAVALLAPRAEVLLANASAAGDPERWQRGFGRVLVVGLAAHLATRLFGWPWPHRFSATVLLVGGLLWLANRQGGSGRWFRETLVRLLPESGGRGLWRGLSRRRVLESMIAEGDPTRLTSGRVRVLMPAFAVDTGRMCYFVNWCAEPVFREVVERTLGEVVTLGVPDDLVQAAAASSAIPVLFQPVRVSGREFVDASLFSSFVVRASVAAGADALLVVLMSPEGSSGPPSEELNLFEVGARFLELGSWRDLRCELGALPAPWSRDGDPASVCVVEPDTALPGGLLRFEPREAVELVRRGEEDAWRALERAGWLEPAAARVP